jgi:S-adenosylmethionine synthetase
MKIHLGKTFYTSESVTEGHPDKLCDQISDAVLDDVLRQDKFGRVACEVFITVGLVIVGGEITTKAYVDLPILVRKLLNDIGYTDTKFGLSAENCSIINIIGKQSLDISQGVDVGGAGDQGLMIGYACNETKELMPLPIMLAHKLCRRLAYVRKQKTLDYLCPDGKSQVTVQYENDKPIRVSSVVIAAQHSEKILDKTGQKITKQARQEIIETVVKNVIPKHMLDNQTKYYVNETGKFVVGGPQSDTGMTGRKLIVDTYGGLVRHGGGAFSGKDPTKVDRTASYFARYVAKNCVAAGVCDRMELSLAYVIGRADPTHISINTYGTAKISEEKLLKIIKEIFNFTPKGMIEKLNLRRPIFQATACYGHFGRTEKKFSWEKLDSVNIIKKAI